MRHFLLLFGVSLSLISQVVFAQLIETEKPINILVLHSYSPSYEWTMNIEQGIKNTIKKSDKSIRLSIEYMDSKRVNGSEYHEKLRL